MPRLKSAVHRGVQPRGEVAAHFIISDINISQCLFSELLLSLAESISVGIQFSRCCVCVSGIFSSSQGKTHSFEDLPPVETLNRVLMHLPCPGKEQSQNTGWICWMFREGGVSPASHSGFCSLTSFIMSNQSSNNPYRLCRNTFYAINHSKLCFPSFLCSSKPCLPCSPE